MTSQQQELSNIRMDLILDKLHAKFTEYQNRYIGDECSVFTRLPISKKAFTAATFNIYYGEHITTGLIPFALPRNGQNIGQISSDITIFDALQYYMDGVASLMVGKSLDVKNDRYQKNVKQYLSKCSLMISLLSQQCLASSALPTPSSPSTSASTNLLVAHFKQLFENLKILYSFCYENPIDNRLSKDDKAKHVHATYLFSLLHSSYWNLSLNPTEKLNWTGNIYINLRYLVQNHQDNSDYIYSLATFCYSFFKIHQNSHQISATRFFNQPKDKTIDHLLYSRMYSYLQESNSTFLREFDKQPIQKTEYWFIYAKTCILLNIEEKSQNWIQLYINSAYDRVELAKIVASDPDVEPYHSKSWYREIMDSVKLEEERRIKEDQVKQQRIEKEQQQAMEQLQNLAIADQFEIIPSAADQYQEVKQSLIFDGYSPKNMNNDALLISSVILLSMTQPKEAKEAEAAKKRLNDRLELYFLKNSKEIPGDGNCQMHALSDQLYGDLNHSQEIRKTIVDWLRKNKDFLFPNGATLCQFVNGSWDDYCNEMSKSGIWGDHLTLLAAAEIFKCKISIISSVESTSHFFIEIIPTKIESPKVLLLSHYSEFHYGSLCFKN